MSVSSPQGDLWALCGVPWVVIWNLPPGISWGNHRSPTCLLSFFLGSMPCSAWCLVSENYCFIYILPGFFGFVFVFFRWEGSSNSCSSIWAASKCHNHFWKHDFYYNVIWGLLTERSKDATSCQELLYSETKEKKILELSTLGDLSSNSSTVTMGKLSASLIPSSLTGKIEPKISTSQVEGLNGM